jgi:hypothetical protein
MPSTVIAERVGTPGHRDTGTPGHRDTGSIAEMQEE